MRLRRFLGFVVLFCLAGCERGCTSDTSATTAGTAGVDLDRARGLAMSAPAGESPIDAEIRLHQKNAESSPRSTDALNRLGRAWIKKARATENPALYANAKACADLVLAQAPEDRVGWNLSALVALNERRFKDAYDLAQRVLAKNAEDVDALGTSSDALLELGRYDEAVKSAERQVELKPFLASYARASYLSWLHGDRDRALDSSRLAIESENDPSDPEPRAWALTQAATIFWHEGDYEGADAGFVKALGALPGYPQALAGRGRVALAKGDAKSAVEYLDQSYQARPSIETAWWLGDAREAAGDAKGAAEAYAHVEKNGRAIDPRTLARYLAVKNKNNALALELSKAELERRPSIYSEDVHAWALYRAGRFTDARQVSERAMRLGTKDAELWYHAGAIRLKTGDLEVGRRLIRSAVALNPGFDATGAAEAKKLLDGHPKGVPSSQNSNPVPK